MLLAFVVAALCFGRALFIPEEPLPIDFLLHDEVRHALRRGFWDALERARR